MNPFIFKVFNSKFFSPLILLLFLTITFYRLPSTFFQQDEWRAFGIFAIFEQNYWEGLRLLLPKTFFEHLALGSFFTEFVQFKFFGLNFSYFAFISLFIHFLNSLLVYSLVLIFSKRKTLSFIAALLFVTNSFSHQATTWISSSTSTQGATFFALVSLIFFFQYIKAEQKNIKLFFYSLVSFFVSLTFKESTIFLFIFFPIFWILAPFEKSFVKFKRLIFPLLLVFCFYLLIRSLSLFNNFSIDEAIKAKTINPSFETYAYRMVSLPFKVLPQSLFPTTLLVGLSNNLVLTAYPHWLVASDGAANPYVVESVAFDYINFILSVFIIFFVFLIFKSLVKAKDKNGIYLLKFSLILIVISYFPFIFIPGIGAFISIAEPRNLYIPSIGSSIFLSLSIMSFSSWISEKIKLKSVLIAATLLLLLLSFNILRIWKDLKVLEKTSETRFNILKTISTSYPNLPEKIIFYTESNTAYYGLGDNDKILPFQSGFGRTLLAWYYSYGEKIPNCMFYDDWLYHLDKDQGYKYCGGKGFGYFRNFEYLRKAISENNLSEENIVAFSWNSKNKQFINITQKTRKALRIK